MKEPSIGWKIATIAGILVSFTAFWSWFSLPTDHPQILDRLGYIAAMFCDLAMLVYCWAAMLAYIATKKNWSPRVCRMAGFSYLIPAVLLACLASRPVMNVGYFLIAPISMVGYLCRKMAYPEMSEEEANAPEPPLSMFPR
jgi:hypothetical protein